MRFYDLSNMIRWKKIANEHSFILLFDTSRGRSVDHYADNITDVRYYTARYRRVIWLLRRFDRKKRKKKRKKTWQFIYVRRVIINSIICPRIICDCSNCRTVVPASYPPFRQRASINRVFFFLSVFLFIRLFIIIIIVTRRFRGSSRVTTAAANAYYRRVRSRGRVWRE